MKWAMIDFETFGNSTQACVVQMGACYFNATDIGPTFKVLVDTEDAVKNGAIIDASTVYWWLGQSDAARKSICGKDKLTEVVAWDSLNEFLSGAEEIWSHATFDFVILTEALKRHNIKPKFNYRAARDIRTLASLSGVDTKSLKREGTHHDALDDAIFQAQYTMKMLGSFKPNG